MEKLGFLASVGKSFELYFKNFGKFFPSYLNPLIWMMAAFIITSLLIIIPRYLHDIKPIFAIIIGITAFIVSIICTVKAIVEKIILDPATVIVAKKLIESGEKPDFQTAKAEVRKDGLKLAEIIGLVIVFALIATIALSLPFAIISALISKSAIIETIRFIFVESIISTLLIFIYQIFAFRKDLRATGCFAESFRFSIKHFLPIFSVCSLYYIVSYCLGSLIALPLKEFIYTKNIAAIVSMTSCIFILSYFLLQPPIHIFVTYWYLRFSEEENA